MKTLNIIIILFFAIACKKLDNTPAVTEETIRFTTNLDSIQYNVSDTLPLTITVSSKLPSAGIAYAITTTWTDSSKQIFKLDTNITTPNFNLNIPGHKKSGNYSLSIIATSRTTSTNKISKSIIFINNPLARFNGYQVDATSKAKDEINYWRDCGVVWDLIAQKFNILPNGQNGTVFFPQMVSGDFNNDGWIDIFNPGTGSFNNKPVDHLQWLIWNQGTKSFENKKLLNDKSLLYFGGNQRRSISYDINKDGYTDIVIFDHGDDVVSSNPLQPIRIMLSDGKGGYDLKELNNVTPQKMYNHSGDIGDLNNDGYPDLVCATGNLYIVWGIKDFPYFGNKASFFDIWNNTDNGFGEWVPEAAGGTYSAFITDINKDGKNDIILGSNENTKKSNSYLPFDLTNRILINQGNGRFNKNGIITLPFYLDDPNADPKNAVISHDFRVVDINNDARLDIIFTGSVNYDDWFIASYIQNSNGSFSINKNHMVYNISTNRKSGQYGNSWKPWLIFYDFNKDGERDLTYIDPHNFWNNSTKNKTVFIKSGSQYIEQDFFQYDPYVKSLLK